MTEMLPVFAHKYFLLALVSLQNRCVIKQNTENEKKCKIENVSVTSVSGDKKSCSFHVHFILSFDPINYPKHSNKI